MLLHMIYYDDWFLSKIQTNSIVFKRISNKMAFAIKKRKENIILSLGPWPPPSPSHAARAHFSVGLVFPSQAQQDGPTRAETRTHASPSLLSV